MAFFTFEEEARREQVLLRAFFMGPTGSGKSKGALEAATRLATIMAPPGGDPLHITKINTERGRGRLYADRFTYSLIDMSETEDFGPEAFVQAIDLAESRHPGGILIIDSATHEWRGKNGVLQQADRFGDWKVVRPKHDDWVERMMAYNGHLIVTCRAKMKYEVSEEDVPGRTKPRQVVSMLGVGPIQDDNLQYEFNLVGRFDLETHDVAFSGHVDPLVDTVANLGDVEQSVRVATDLAKWLNEGDPPQPPPAATDEDIAELVALLVEDGNSPEAIEERFVQRRLANRGVLHPDYVSDQIGYARKRIAEKAATAAD